MTPLALFSRRETVLIVFMIVTSVNNAVFAMNQGASEAWQVPLLAFATYAVLAHYTYKRQPLTTWAMIVLLFYYGSGFAVDGIRGLTDSMPVSLLRLTAGAYFVWGGLIVFRTRRPVD